MTSLFFIFSPPICRPPSGNCPEESWPRKAAISRHQLSIHRGRGSKLQVKRGHSEVGARTSTGQSANCFHICRIKFKTIAQSNMMVFRSKIGMMFWINWWMIWGNSSVMQSRQVRACSQMTSIFSKWIRPTPLPTSRFGLPSLHLHDVYYHSC